MVLFKMSGLSFCLLKVMGREQAKENNIKMRDVIRTVDHGSNGSTS